MTIDTATIDFVVSRTFDAPRDLVWKAWTEADRMAKWWGPKGSTIRIIKFELRPGGTFHYAMAYQAGGPEIFGRFVYREIAAPDRMTWISSFSDAQGGITRAPFPQLGDKWPLEVFNTLTFTGQGGKTTITLRAGPINATEDEIKTFVGMHQSMNNGFNGTFDQLEAYLKSA